MYDEAGRFICLAAANARVPYNATAEDLRAAIADKKQARKALKNYHEKRLRLTEDLPDLVARAARARWAQASQNQAAGASDPPPPPPTIQPIRTPLEQQLPAVQRALAHRPMRLAAGGEHEPAGFTYRPALSSPAAECGEMGDGEGPSFRYVGQHAEEEP